MAHGHMDKGAAEKSMLVVKLGGPAYRIGLGGGAASSMVQGQNVQDLDFNAVQRGDAEMENKLNRYSKPELSSQNFTNTFVLTLFTGQFGRVLNLETRTQLSVFMIKEPEGMQMY